MVLLQNIHLVDNVHLIQGLTLTEEIDRSDECAVAIDLKILKRIKTKFFQINKKISL